MKYFSLLNSPFSFINLDTMTVVFLLLIFAIFLLLKRSSKNHENLPPGPKPLPIIGNLLLLGEKPHRSLAQLAKIYGPVMSLKLGQVTTIVVSSPELAREVLVKKDQVFCNRWVPDAMHALKFADTSVVFSPADQHWKNLRIICGTQLFVSQKLDCNKSLRHKKVRELISYLHECGKGGESVNIGRVAFMTTLNLISNILFSINMVDAYSNSAQDFRDLMRGIMEESGSMNISDLFPIIRGLDLQGKRRKLEGYFKRLHKIFDEHIDDRLKAMEISSGSNKDFLDTLVNCRVDGSEKKIDRDTMRSLLMDVFIAGSETSSSTIEWAMAELLHSPKSMARARAELAQACTNKTELDESDILNLPYLRAVIKEVLRLHPPAPFLVPRRTKTDVELYNYNVPKNTRVLVNAWAIGHDESIWRDADVFMPERFLALEREVEYKGRDFELIPFGAGRRICPGLPLSFRMVHLTLASLLHRFDWKLSDGMRTEDVDLSEKFGLTLAPAASVHAIPIPVE